MRISVPLLLLTTVLPTHLTSMPLSNSLINQFRNLQPRVENHIQHRLLENRTQNHETPPPIPPNRPTAAPQVPARHQYNSSDGIAKLRERWTYQIIGDPAADRSTKEAQRAIHGMSVNMGNLLKTYKPCEDRVFENVGPLTAKDMKFRETYSKVRIPVSLMTSEITNLARFERRQNATTSVVLHWCHSISV